MITLIALLCLPAGLVSLLTGACIADSLARDALAAKATRGETP